MESHKNRPAQLFVLILLQLSAPIEDQLPAQYSKIRSYGFCGFLLIMHFLSPIYILHVFLGLCARVEGPFEIQERALTSRTIASPTTANTSFFSAPTILPYHKNASNPYLGAKSAREALISTPGRTGPKCIVIPLGWGLDDSSQILAAVERCGVNGTITMPAPYVYIISRRMYMKLSNARLEVFGTLAFTADLSYWIENSFRIEFQNQSTAWIVEGHNFEIDGGGWNRGGIDGNGQAWMTHAAGLSNLYGRPVSLSIYNSTNVVIRDFSIRQPQFWSFWIQDSSDLDLGGIYINGTNTDPYGNSSNFDINIDGLDTLRVDNISIHDWVFRGGDDCLALKGNTTNTIIRNVTCIGGGIAFGSIGQYVESPDNIINVTASDIVIRQDIKPHLGGASVAGGIYFKSWVGKEAGVPPQGGGGGTGMVSNITISNLVTDNTTQAVYINKCYYKVPDQANYCDTSTLNFRDLRFVNVSGTVNSNVGIALNCSAAAICTNIVFRDVELMRSRDKGDVIVTCVNVHDVHGLECNSTIPRSTCFI